VWCHGGTPAGLDRRGVGRTSGAPPNPLNRDEDRFVEDGLARLRHRLALGLQPVLYRVVKLSSDFCFGAYSVGSAPQAGLLLDLGLDGWHVVGTAPHTTALPFMNESSGLES
jgi:hypothetical protein